MAIRFKSPLEQSQAMAKIPAFDKAATISFLKQYGDAMTDYGYEAWAKERGKQLAPKTPTPGYDPQQSFFAQHMNPDTYANQYLNDDEWLQEYFKENYNDIDEYITDYGYDGIDDDYERSFGPVNSREKYDSYLKWKENN